ncbi:hypothetical protein ME763_37650 (plasmid) [Streptomyces murinus]|uniref:hypothetical protein n=1 Tax=Streptomyces murinus TaxID=33900 RepID=UPI00117FF26A|nr:hypothetical protein [Streptomyces murinus]WDO11244.1 hypothetical protein ME763_37650 [Streptomyces murinus]
MADETAVMQQLWPQVLEATKKRRRFTWILLSQNVKAFFYDGAVLTLAWGSQSAVDNFVSSGSSSVLEAALGEVFSRPASVESVLEMPPVPPLLRPSAPASPMCAPATTPDPPSRPDAAAASTLHHVLGQTAFLMHERGDNRAAALLTDVADVELVRSGRFTERVDAVLIVPSSFVPRFTDEVLAAVEPVFVHVAVRHGLQINRVRADTALPEIGADWRQTLHAILPEETTPEQAPQLPSREASLTSDWEEAVVVGQTSGCSRRGKTTGRRCRRPAADWPAYDDLPSPVAACYGHLTPEEQEACQQARDRARKEFNTRWKAELAARQAEGGETKPRTFTPRPCIGQCTSQEIAWGRDSDGASMSCANCDSWVCVSCGQAQVEHVLEFCAGCSEREAMFDPEPDWDGPHDGEPDIDPNPHARLTTMVNELVKATGTTHRDVNARLNRRIGVRSRVGADEQVIRRAAGAARAWLDELGSFG